MITKYGLVEALLQTATKILTESGYTLNKWIRVSDRMPTEADADEHGNVLARTYLGQTYTARTTEIPKFDDFYTHWMPIPELLEAGDSR